MVHTKLHKLYMDHRTLFSKTTFFLNEMLKCFCDELAVEV